MRSLGLLNAAGYRTHLAPLWTTLESFTRVEAYDRQVSARPAFQASLLSADDTSPLEGRST